MQLVWRLVVPVVNLFCDSEPIKLIWSVIFISSFLSSLVSILPPRSIITWVEMKIGNEKQACAHYWFCLVIFWSVWSSDGLCLSSHRASSDVTSVFQMLSWLMKMKDTKQRSYLLNVRDCQDRPREKNSIFSFYTQNDHPIIMCSLTAVAVLILKATAHFCHVFLLDSDLWWSL